MLSSFACFSTDTTTITPGRPIISSGWSVALLSTVVALQDRIVELKDRVRRAVRADHDVFAALAVSK